MVMFEGLAIYIKLEQTFESQTNIYNNHGPVSNGAYKNWKPQ